MLLCNAYLFTQKLAAARAAQTRGALDGEVVKTERSPNPLIEFQMTKKIDKNLKITVTYNSIRASTKLSVFTLFRGAYVKFENHLCSLSPVFDISILYDFCICE